MNIEPKQPTRKAPADWFTGDAYIDAIHDRKPGPSRMACGCVHFTPGTLMVHIAMYEGTADDDGARWLEHVTDEQHKAAATAIETD